jgi:predicted XRE-type DNA-binding protein
VDFTPEEWLEGLTGEAELNPTIKHPSPDFEALVERATERLNVEHELVTSLKQLRKRLGLTQVDVAEKWGRKQSQVSKVERAPEGTELATLVGYVQALGGSISLTIEVDGHVYHEDLIVT